MVLLSDMRIGVIGLGSIGMRHANNLIEMGYDIIGFDPSEERQKLFIDKGGIIVDREQLFEHSDAVVIASPNQFHLQDLKNAIDSGCHAFVEKPLAHKTEGLDVVKKLSQVKKLIICVGMNIRINPAIIHLKEAIDKKTIGSVIWGEYTLHSYLPDWRLESDHRSGYAADPKTGGVIFDSAHGLDILYFLMGDYSVKSCVARSSGMIGIDSDDIADIICVHEGGVTSRLHMDYITKPKEHSVVIATDQGFARVNISKREYEWETHEGTKTIVNYSDSVINDDYKKELELFLASAFLNEKIHSPLEEAINVTQNTMNARFLAGLPS